jgi:hypothetical protein
VYEAARITNTTTAATQSIFFKFIFASGDAESEDASKDYFAATQLLLPFSRRRLHWD